MLYEVITVGTKTLGRIMNVVGEPIDERGPVGSDMHAPIHAEAPEFIDQSTEAAILVTGIKVIDLLAPYAKGGKIGLVITSYSIHYTKLYEVAPTRA